MKKHILVFDNPEKLYDFIINKLREINQAALKEKRFASVAFSGGRSPVPFYEKLAKADVNWENIRIFQVDERFVGRNDKDNNFSLIESTLLKSIKISPDNVYGIDIKDTPDISAKSYEEKIKACFNLNSGELPRFDLIILGLGSDGHTASLFPDTQALYDKNSLAVTVSTKSAPYIRISFGLGLINNSACVIFLVTRSDKAKAVKEIIENQESKLPAALVKPKGNLIFVLDQDAASRIEED